MSSSSPPHSNPSSYSSYSNPYSYSHSISLSKKYSIFSSLQLLKYSQWFSLLSKSKTGTIELDYLLNIFISTTIIKNKKEFLLTFKDFKTFENGLINFDDFLDILILNVESRKIQLYKLDKLIDSETNLSPDTMISAERRKLLMEHIVNRTALRGWGMDLTEHNEHKRLLRHNSITQLITHKTLRKKNTLDELSKLHEKQKQEASEVIWELSDGLKRERDILQTIDSKRRENEYRKNNKLKYSTSSLPVILPLDDLVTNPKLLESIQSEQFAQLFEKKVLPKQNNHDNNNNNNNNNPDNNNNNNNELINKRKEIDEIEENNIEMKSEDNDQDNLHYKNNYDNIHQNTKIKLWNQDSYDDNIDNDDDNDDNFITLRSNCSSPDCEINSTSDWITALSKYTPHVTKSFDSSSDSTTLPSLNLSSTQFIDNFPTQKFGEKSNTEISSSTLLLSSTSQLIPISNTIQQQNINPIIKFSPPRNSFTNRSQKITSAPLRRVASYNTLNSNPSTTSTTTSSSNSYSLLSSSSSSSLLTQSSQSTQSSNLSLPLRTITPTKTTISSLSSSSSPSLSSSPSSSILILPNSSRSISPSAPLTTRSKTLLTTCRSISSSSSKNDKLQDDDHNSETSISLDISNEVLGIHPIEQYTPVSVQKSSSNLIQHSKKNSSPLLVRQLSPLQRSQQLSRPSTSEKNKRETISCSQFRH